MEEELYLSAYYHDPDHPYGIVLLKIIHEDFNNYILLKELYEEFIKLNLDTNERKHVSGYYWDREQKEHDFSQKLFCELNSMCEDNTILAKDRGWKDFSEMKYMGWVVIQLARDKKEFFNDGFWEIK